MISVVIVLAVTCLIVSSMFMLYKSIWPNDLKEKFNDNGNDDKQKFIQLQLAQRQLNKSLSSESKTFKEYMTLIRDLSLTERIKYVINLPVVIRTAIIVALDNNSKEILDNLPENTRQEILTFNKAERSRLQQLARQAKTLREPELQNILQMMIPLSLDKRIIYLVNLPVSTRVQVINRMSPESITAILVNFPLINYAETKIYAKMVGMNRITN